MAITTNMGLTTWASGDSFNDAQLRANWQAVDLHDHTTGKGKPIPANGLQKDSVTETKIADGSVTSDKIVDASVSQYKLAPDLSAALDRAKISLSENTVFGLNNTSNVTGGYENLILKSQTISDVHISDSATIDPKKINLRNSQGSILTPSSLILDTESNSTTGAIKGKFGANTITEGAIGPSQIAPLAVTNDKIAVGTISSDRLNFSPNTPSAGSVTPAMLSNTAWTAYSPTMAVYNASVNRDGTNSLTGYYQRLNNVVHYRIILAVGSGGIGFTYTGANDFGSQFGWFQFGYMTFSLPLAVKGGSYNVVGEWSAHTNLNNYWGQPPPRWSGIVQAGGGSSNVILRNNGDYQLGPLWPQQWSQGSTNYWHGGNGFYPTGVQISGTYEVQP